MNELIFLRNNVENPLLFLLHPSLYPNYLESVTRSYIYTWHDLSHRLRSLQQSSYHSYSHTTTYFWVFLFFYFLQHLFTIRFFSSHNMTKSSRSFSLILSTIGTTSMFSLKYSFLILIVSYHSTNPPEDSHLCRNSYL